MERIELPNSQAREDVRHRKRFHQTVALRGIIADARYLKNFVVK